MAISTVLLRQSKLMTMRWRERRVEDELLMRELLLRLHAEHSGASGRSEPATGHLRRRAHRLLLRHPLFALRYYLLANELGLEGKQRLLSFAWLVHARRERRAAVAGLRWGLRRQRRLMRLRVLRGGRASGSALTHLTAAGRRQRLLWHARLIRVCRGCESACAGLAARLGRRLLVVRGGLARLVAEGRHLRLLLYARLIRVCRSCASAVSALVAALRRERLVAQASLVRLHRASRSAVVGLAAALRLEWLVLQARIVRFGSRACALPGRVVGASRVKRPRLQYRRVGTVAVLAGVAAAVATATVVVATHKTGAKETTGAAAAARPQLSRRVEREFSHAPRAVSTPAEASQRRPAQKRVDRRTSRPGRHARTTSVQRLTLVSNTVQTTTEAAAPSYAAPQGHGPAPLQAPPAPPAPSPLKAP